MYLNRRIIRYIFFIFSSKDFHCLMMSVVSLIPFFDPHISPPADKPPPIKKTLRTQIIPGLIGGKIRYFIIDKTGRCCAVSTPEAHH